MLPWSQTERGRHRSKRVPHAEHHAAHHAALVAWRQGPTVEDAVANLCRSKSASKPASVDKRPLNSGQFRRVIEGRSQLCITRHLLSILFYKTAEASKKLGLQRPQLSKTVWIMGSTMGLGIFSYQCLVVSGLLSELSTGSIGVARASSMQR